MTTKMLAQRCKNRFDASARGSLHKIPGENARSLASKRVSPQRPGMRMHTYYINRAGKA